MNFSIQSLSGLFLLVAAVSTTAPTSFSFVSAHEDFEQRIEEVEIEAADGGTTAATTTANNNNNNNNNNNKRKHRTLFWKKGYKPRKKEDLYLDIYQRCCEPLQTATTLAEPRGVSPCDCPVRNESGDSSWNWWNINWEKKWNNKCRKVIKRKSMIDDFDIVADGQSIYDVAAATAEFSTLVSKLKDANLVDTLSRRGPYTVWAPVNSAFESIDIGDDPLPEILLNHVNHGNLPSRSLTTETLATVAGENIRIDVTDSGITVNGKAKVANVLFDIITNNGVIHAIDRVLNLNGGVYPEVA